MASQNIYLDIGDGWLLDIGDGYLLLIATILIADTEGRLYIIKLPDRTLSVPFASRELTMKADDRQLSAPASDREYIIKQDDRTYEIQI